MCFGGQTTIPNPTSNPATYSTDDSASQVSKTVAPAATTPQAAATPTVPKLDLTTKATGLNVQGM